VPFRVRSIAATQCCLLQKGSLESKLDSSVKNRQRALAKAENPEEEYIQHVLPAKIRLAKEYVQRSSFLLDLSLIFKTLFRLFAHTSEANQSRGTHSLHKSIS
jgi:hypothetical protein